MLPFPLIPWPSKEDMEDMRPLGDVGEDVYAVRLHRDGSVTYLTEQEYEELCRHQK